MVVTLPPAFAGVSGDCGAHFPEAKTYSVSCNDLR